MKLNLPCGKSLDRGEHVQYVQEQHVSFTTISTGDFTVRSTRRVEYWAYDHNTSIINLKSFQGRYFFTAFLQIFSILFFQ